MPRVIEIMINPDGALRLDRLGEGRTDTGVRMDGAQVERIIRLVASHARDRGPWRRTDRLGRAAAAHRGPRR